MKPKKWADFVLNGAYRKVIFNSHASLVDDDHVLYVTGCGRSGTTLCFSLLKPLKLSGVKLDEPREIYLSLWGPEFDIWSINANNPKILPTPPKLDYNI